MAESPELIGLKIAQLSQIVEQYRSNMYTTELRFNLLLKMLEEKGMFLAGELDKRWPQYLQKEIGVPDQNGMMEGTLKCHLYER